MAGENDMDPSELLDYDEEDNAPEAAGQNEANGAENSIAKKPVKGSYVSIHSSGFRDFLLKPELLRAIVDCGFEHPSEGETRETALFAFRLSAILSATPIFVASLPFPFPP